MPQIIDDDDVLSSICLTEQRNAMASIISDGGDIWSASPSLTGGAGLPHGLGGAPAHSTPTPPRVPVHALRQADRMLQSYEREMSSVESTLREMEENLATTRWIWSCMPGGALVPGGA